MPAVPVQILITFILKIKSIYLQKCHWSCFSHKISVLTPFWPVQVVLDS
jgi:hypothetical protein